MAKGTRSRTGYSTRIGSGIGGNNDAGGGVFEGLPLGAFANNVGMVYFNDFVDAADADDFTVSTIGVGGTTGILANVANGVYSLLHTVADIGNSVQLTGGAGGGRCIPSANVGVDTHGRIVPRAIGIEILAFSNEWTSTDWFLGVSNTDTTFMGTDGSLTGQAADEHVGFHHVVANAGSPLLSANAGISQTTLNPTSSMATLVDGTWHKFGIRINGLDEIRWYVDGLPVSDTLVIVTPQIFSFFMLPTFAFVAAGGGATSIQIDTLAVAQTRIVLG